MSIHKIEKVICQIKRGLVASLIGMGSRFYIQQSSSFNLAYIDLL